MQEIELKFKVDNLEDTKDKLNQLGCNLSKEKHQKDTIFLPDIEDTSNGAGKIFVRIRNVNGKVEMNLKRATDKIMQSKEIEFEVSSYEDAYDFLETLGLTKWVSVEKRRVTTKYKGFNICMDKVDRLGEFIEIEIITNEEDKTDYYEKRIIEIAKELNIDVTNRINNFYDTMISELDRNDK